MTSRLSRILAPGVAGYAIASAAALAVAWAAFHWGTRTAGGADSYGYVSQASLWLQGSLIVDQPIARTVPWPNADWTFAPLGYRPGLEPGTIVPVYSSGLPIAMALLQAVGGPSAVYLVVPLLGAILVLASASMAIRMSAPVGGAVAALLVASSPIVLSSVMWPMSDVPAAAWWALALALAPAVSLASAIGSGVAIAMAILTRPNLFGLALAPMLYLAWRCLSSTHRKRDAMRFVVVAMLTILACLAVALIHTKLYGSPFISGYGGVAEVFSVSNAPANTAGFLMRPLRYEPFLAVLGLIGAVLLLGPGNPPGVRSMSRLAAGATALVLGSYAFYLSSPDWWYLRFLLPAYPAVAALAGAGATRLARTVAEPLRTLGLVMVCGLIVTSGVGRARELGVFGVRASESRYRAVAYFVARDLPENAVFFAFQESGSLRHYAGRMTLRFDLLRPEYFEIAITKMRARGYRPYFLVEDPELELFKTRFQNASTLGALDWPPVADLRGHVRVQIFDPADRGKWRRGERVPTQLIPQAALTPDSRN